MVACPVTYVMGRMIPSVWAKTDQPTQPGRGTFGHAARHTRHVNVFRPCDTVETGRRRGELALTSDRTPSVLALTRQKPAHLPHRTQVSRT